MNDPAIARSARRLRLVVLAAIVLVVAVYLAAWLGLQFGPVRVQSQPDAGRWQGQALLGLTLLLFVTALARLAQMLGAVADGPLFGPRVTRAFRGFAFWLFLATLAEVVAAPLMAIADRVEAGSGRTELAFELGDLLRLAGALFLFLLARMLEQARALESELEEIV